MDKITETRIALLHPKIKNEVFALVEKANQALKGRAQVRIVQGFRTFAEQDILYKQRPKVTNAKGGESFHNYGFAFDFALLIDSKEISWDPKKDWDNDNISDWLEVMQIFIAAGYKSGKAFNDLPHFEKTFGYTYKALLKLYKAGKFIPGTRFVNI